MKLSYISLLCTVSFLKFLFKIEQMFTLSTQKVFLRGFIHSGLLLSECICRQIYTMLYNCKWRITFESICFFSFNIVLVFYFAALMVIRYENERKNQDVIMNMDRKACLYKCRLIPYPLLSWGYRRWDWFPMLGISFTLELSPHHNLFCMVFSSPLNTAEPLKHFEMYTVSTFASTFESVLAISST